MDSICVPLLICRQTGIYYQGAVACYIELIRFGSDRCIGVNPDGIAVAISVLCKTGNRITGFVTQLEHDVTVLSGDGSLIAALFYLFISDGTLGVNAGKVARLNHLLDLSLVGVPVRIEHARNTRH